MKAIFILVTSLLLFLSVSLHAQMCGPKVDFESKTMAEKDAIESTPPTGKALVYVVASGSMVQVARYISVDREWIGVVRSKNYLVAAVAPGRRDLCASLLLVSKPWSTPLHVAADLEAGKTYYFHVDAWDKHFSQITSEEAEEWLPKAKRRIFWPKGTPEPKQ